MKRTERASAVLVVGLAVLLVPAAATSAALVPAPGTGHGVLSQATSAEEDASLEYSPGIGVGGKECEASPLIAGPATTGNVGLPVSLCIGRFPTTAIQVTITPPRGPTITLRDQSIPSGLAGAGITVLVLPSPPDTRYSVTDESGLAAEGKLSGDGGGIYTVRARGGARSSTATFVLEPPPTTRLTNLIGAEPTVAPGKRLRFGAAGQKPLATFQVAIFGPQGYGESDNDTYPVRAMLTARADKKGEAIIVLDTLASAPTGQYVALLDPQTPLESSRTLGPRAALFNIRVPKPE